MNYLSADPDNVWIIDIETDEQIKTFKEGSTEEVWQ